MATIVVIFGVGGIFWLAFAMTVSSFITKQREANRQILAELRTMVEELKRMRRYYEPDASPPATAEPVREIEAPTGDAVERALKSMARKKS